MRNPAPEIVTRLPVDVGAVLEPIAVTERAPR